MNQKQQNGFNMSAHALGDASATVKGHLVQIVRQHGGDVAAPIPFTVKSVLRKSEALQFHQKVPCI